MDLAGDRHREGVHELALGALLFLSSLSNHVGNHELALSYGTDRRANGLDPLDIFGKRWGSDFHLDPDKSLLDRLI